MISEKIRPHHLQRKALLYVRQSSAHQVLHNRESSALQYAMRDRLVALGWSQIEVIDDDLGRSAAGGTQRSGFERMVAEVCLGKVGAVCAREVSRFARNSRDWQQLIEMCRVVDTVLIDQETVYAPRHGNDRLLLGLKGSLNEYELDLLRQRSLAARYEKARRGELVVSAPVGFVTAHQRQRCNDGLATSKLRHHPSDDREPDLRRCLCLRQDSCGGELWYPRCRRASAPQGARRLAGVEAERP
jgi:DNA invertase Pin-like site-specific DNA recombinase